VQVKASGQPLGNAAHGKELFYGGSLRHVPHGGGQGRPTRSRPQYDRFGALRRVPC
jgi:hypothetical protein